jgi:hypothetical protein
VRHWTEQQQLVRDAPRRVVQSPRAWSTSDRWTPHPRRCGTRSRSHVHQCSASVHSAARRSTCRRTPRSRRRDDPDGIGSLRPSAAEHTGRRPAEGSNAGVTMRNRGPTTSTERPLGSRNADSEGAAEVAPIDGSADRSGVLSCARTPVAARLPADAACTGSPCLWRGRREIAAPIRLVSRRSPVDVACWAHGRCRQRTERHQFGAWLATTTRSVRRRRVAG